MDFKCDELISEKTDADSRALTVSNLGSFYNDYLMITDPTGNGATS